MIFILPVNLETLARRAEELVARHQPNRSYDIEIVTRPRKREVSVNVRSRGPWYESGRFRYQILPLTKV